MLGVIEFNLSIAKFEAQSEEFLANVRKHLTRGHELILEYNKHIPNRYGSTVLENSLRFLKIIDEISLKEN